MMKLKITFLLFLFLHISYGQVTNEGQPLSWSLTTKAKDLAAITMPKFDLEKIQAEDKINDAGKNKPWRYGHQFLVDHNLENSGVWNELPNGDRIWRIRYSSPGAHTLNFLFSDFYMPKGAKVYLYANDRSDLLGAYDDAQNNEKRVLGTWLVTGDDVVIEYYEPKEVKGQGKLEVFKVVHGYRSVGNYEKGPAQDLNGSGSCHYDVNCDIPQVNDLKAINKKAVGLIIVSGNSFCTGALINNVTNDGTPYFLTANHCAEDEDVTEWSFRFNWISPNPVCAQSINSTANTNFYQTVSGAELKAKRAASDFCLLKITATMPSTWNLVYAGWSRSETQPQSTFGIHHPAGDIMKVSCDFDAPNIDNSGGEFMWEVYNWDLGVTEGGSSGSPLFDNNGRIIGQLYGGISECSGTSGNGGYDVYGRFGRSWTGGGTNATRLSNWLDPNGTNAQTVNYKEVNPSLSLEDVVKAEVNVYPNPSNGIFTVAIDADASYSVFSVLGQEVANGQLTAGDNSVNMAGKSNGIYILKVTTASGKSASYKLVKE